LIAKVAQSDFFRAELLLSFDFSGLTLLFIAFDGFEPRLEFGKPILKRFPLGCRILCVVYEIFDLLDIGDHVLPLVLSPRELLPSFIEALRGTRDTCFLPLQPIDENLGPLRCDGRRAQILSHLAHF
jgi:hypothetical protein